MTLEDAEEYTQALGQVVAGGWRQIALGHRLGVPQALNLSVDEWVNQRLGGYVRLSIEDRRSAASELASQGSSQRQIGQVLGVSQATVNADLAIDRNLSPSNNESPQKAEKAHGNDGNQSQPTKNGVGVPKTRAAFKQRREEMRRMASEGYSSRQIAAKLGLSDEGTRAILKKEQIDVPADRVIGHSKHHNSNRIVAAMALTAETLFADTKLIIFSKLDRAQLEEWITTFLTTKGELSAFIQRLKKERNQQHGEAA